MAWTSMGTEAMPHPPHNSGHPLPRPTTNPAAADRSFPATEIPEARRAFPAQHGPPPPQQACPVNP
eukprot:4934369-Alexandrium_andersonii.AAC.1